MEKKKDKAQNYNNFTELNLPTKFTTKRTSIKQKTEFLFIIY